MSELKGQGLVMEKSTHPPAPSPFSTGSASKESLIFSAVASPEYIFCSRHKASDEGRDNYPTPSQFLQLGAVEQDSFSCSWGPHIHVDTQDLLVRGYTLLVCVFTQRVSRLISAVYLWRYFCPVLDVFHVRSHGTGSAPH